MRSQQTQLVLVTGSALPCRENFALLAAATVVTYTWLLWVGVPSMHEYTVCPQLIIVIYNKLFLNAVSSLSASWTKHAVPSMTSWVNLTLGIGQGNVSPARYSVRCFSRVYLVTRARFETDTGTSYQLDDLFALQHSVVTQVHLQISL